MKAHPVLICTIAVFLLNSFAAEKTQRLIVAINDLKGTGLDPAAITIISERLRSEVINTGVFRVMERAEMESILKEQGFQQTGACEESSCLIEVGQLLGVNRIVAGSVGAVGSFWTISLRMLSVETGEVLFTVNEDYEGDIKGVISTATARAASKLVSGAGTEIKKAELAGKTGDLYIETSETGAKVEIDGKAMKGVTPLKLKGFQAGDLEITVRKGTLSGSQKITLRPDIQLRVNIPMQADKGSVKITTEPAGASVFLSPTSKTVSAQMQEGGPEEIGKTPYESDTIDPGDYWLLLRKKSYSDGYTKITVKSNETARYADTLYKSCRFLVFTYGISSLNAPTLRIREEGVFNREYQGIQWKTVSHLGVDLSPIRFNIPPKGRHSFMIADEMGISVDQNVSKAGQIRKIDNIAKDTVIKEGALKINRLILDAKLALGYRLMLYPLALEPYAGADFRIFNLVHLRGPLIDSTDSWNMPNMRISFPFGARIYLYASRRTALVLGCEYNADMTFVKMLDALDYDKIRRKNITGGFPTENVSTLVLSLGATF